MVRENAQEHARCIEGFRSACADVRLARQYAFLQVALFAAADAAVTPLGANDGGSVRAVMPYAELLASGKPKDDAQTNCTPG